MPDFLSVETIAITIIGYPLSYLELVGTIFYLWSVWLIARRNMLTWPIGIISVILYMLLFYQIQLYSDTIEQIYYLGASVYGWWYWRKTAAEDAQKPGIPVNVRYSSTATIGIVVVFTLVLSVIVSGIMSQIHLWLPTIFPLPADYPFLDALTTVMSFTAMALMAQKRTESWIYWIIVDIIGIGLYFVKDVKFIALLYVILLGIAINGFITWHRAVQKQKLELQTVSNHA